MVDLCVEQDVLEKAGGPFTQIVLNEANIANYMRIKAQSGIFVIVGDQI